MSKIEVDTIDTVTGTSTLQVGSTNTSTINLGASGDSVIIPSGVTITNNGTQTGFGGVNTPAFSAYRDTSTPQVIATGVYTVGELTGTFFDTDNAFNTSTYRFTVPSGKGGIYIFHFGTVFTSSLPDGTAYNVGIKVNGNINYGSLQSNTQGAGGNVTFKGSWTISLNAGDYVELLTRQAAGGNENFTGGSPSGNILPYLSGFRLIQ